MDGARDALHDAVVGAVTRALDHVLAPYGFAPGTGALGSPRHDPAGSAPHRDGQVIFCRAFPSGAPGCEDVVVDLLADPLWHVRTVRDGDDPLASWTVDYDPTPLTDQLPTIAAELARRIGAGS